ncbi:hypothetical protein BST26_03260 [Mycolicibacterium insubricum]|uniref:YVTN family beta-propeller repeat protein n=1 Tax=Mycolicibacterium insubricum TaxID=444597 RepID=A0A1X0DL40_9MYCO|nr:hypothetical protein BST26_03260 [Mycolicibacterium insubricum]
MRDRNHNIRCGLPAGKVSTVMANKARALDLTAGSTGALAESSVAPLSRWSPVAADMTASRADVGRGPIAGIALDASAGQLYVTNPADGSVAVLDIDTMAVTQVITDLPEAHAVGAAGGSVYVSIVSLDTDAVSIVDTALQSGEEALADIYPVKETVRDLALSPEGERIYLARTTETGADVAVVDIITGAVSTIAVPATTDSSAEAIAVSLDGRRVYLATADHLGGRLIAIDTHTQRVVGVRDLPSQPHALAVSRDGSTLLVARCDPHAGSDLDLVDAQGLRMMESVPVAGLLTEVAFSVAGERIYLVSGGRVSVLNAGTLEIVNTFDGVTDPSCIVESADGAMLFVGGYDGKVSALPVGEITDELLAQMMSADVIDVPMLELAQVAI